MNVTREDYERRNTIILDFADQHNLPCLVLMGGGYSVPIDHSVDGFADMYIEAGKRHKNRMARK